MAESSWPSPSVGRVVDDNQYEQLARSYGALAGVVGDFTSPQMVYGDSSGMQVKIRSGRYGLVMGHTWYSGSVEFTKTIAANSSGSTRTDLVVLRYSRTTYEVTTEVVTGTPGGGVPAATQNTGSTGNYELPLATVTVASGASSISAANVVYVAAHLSADGGGYRVAATSALPYIPSPYAGMTAFTSDGKRYGYVTGTTWEEPLQFKYVDAAVSETRTSNTTFSDSTYIQFTVQASKIYRLLFDFILEGGAGGAKFRWTYPSGTEHNWGGMVPEAMGLSDSIGEVNYLYFDRETGTASSGLGIVNLVNIAGTAVHFQGSGLVRVGGSGGNYRMQWAQNTSSATVNHLIRNSWASLERLT